MTGRIRTIKPDFFIDEQLGRLGPLCRLLFVGLWVHADREGRLENRPVRLKTLILPYDNVEVDVLLGELAAPPGCFIELYEEDGKSLIQVRTFLEHQRPNSREPASCLPAPPSQGEEEDDAEPPQRGEAHVHARARSRGREGKGREGKEIGDFVSSGAPAERATPAAQAEALLIYPTVRGKRTGAVEWRLTENEASLLREGYPDLDVLAEARKARAWILAKPDRRKTADGMMPFLVGWLGRVQNRGAARTGPPAAAPRRPSAPSGLCAFHVDAENANRPARRPESACSECRHVAARNRRAGEASEPTPIGVIASGMGATPELAK